MASSRFARSVFFGTLVSSALLTGCFGGGADLGVHVSPEGLVPEAYLPSDLGMVLSYSLNDEVQYKAVQGIEEKLGDSGRFSRTVAESFNSQFLDLGLDYEKDLLPAFGDQFRWVYGARPKEEGAEVFSVTTLADPEQLVSVFDTLSDAGTFEKKVLSGKDVYVNEEQGFYCTIHGDLLLVSDTPEDLMSMLEQDEEDSLWETETYQSAMEDVGQEFVFYGFLFPQFYEGTTAGALSLETLPSVLERQSLVVRAEEAGLRFDVTMLADEDKAKEVDLSFDLAPKENPYLFEEVPAEGLMAYFESYGLQQTLEQADKLGTEATELDSLRESFRNYFGMDFDDEFMSWFDKGYVMALHQNGSGLFPGITVYVDSSSDEEHAQELLDKIDAQVSGLMSVFEMSLPDAANAIARETVKIQGEDFTKVTLDLTELSRTEVSPLPSSIMASDFSLMYGTLEGRVLLTTATAWEEENPEMVSGSPLYDNLKSKIDEADQGLILLDAGEVADFAASLRALREQLGLEVSDSSLDLEKFLEGFEGVIAQSKTGAYSSIFSGYLMLAD